MEIIKKSELPTGVAGQLLDNETVYYFSYISFKGGCLSSDSIEDHWVALTDKRFLFKSKVKDETSPINYIQKDGFIPFDKISFIEITKAETAQGCGNTSVSYELRVGSSGGTTRIPIPTESKGFEVRKAYMETLANLKKDL